MFFHISLSIFFCRNVCVCLVVCEKDCVCLAGGGGGGVVAALRTQVNIGIDRANQTSFPIHIYSVYKSSSVQKRKTQIDQPILIQRVENWSWLCGLCAGPCLTNLKTYEFIYNLRIHSNYKVRRITMDLHCSLFILNHFYIFCC